jgi:hypothetical protein
MKPERLKALLIIGFLLLAILIGHKLIDGIINSVNQQTKFTEDTRVEILKKD